MENFKSLTFALVEASLVERINTSMSSHFCDAVEYDSTYFLMSRKTYDGICTSAESGAME